MCLKIRCDEKFKKNCKIFWEPNRPLAKTKIPFWRAPPVIPGHFEFLILMRIPHQTPSPRQWSVVTRHQDSPARSSALRSTLPRLDSALPWTTAPAKPAAKARYAEFVGPPFLLLPNPYRGPSTELAGVIPPGRSLTRVFCRCRSTRAVRIHFRSLPVRSPLASVSRESSVSCRVEFGSLAVLTLVWVFCFFVRAAGHQKLVLELCV
jgi:hypothetical protein